MERGSIKKIAALGLNPVIIRVNRRSRDAMELREAKKPLVVENRPIRASANTGRLIRGDRNTFSVVFLQENTGARPEEILEKNLFVSKPLANRSSERVSGW
jgi:hypothetical protein